MPPAPEEPSLAEPSAPGPATARLVGAAQRAGVLAPGDRLLVAVSGGADSLALLHLLAHHGEAIAPGVQLVAAHLDHGLRGAAAAADADFVATTAAAWGVPTVRERVDVRALARERRQSIETAGRAARYDFFLRAAQAHGCGKIALAHTADDQAETVLLNLLRGTGIEGLAGMPVRRPLAGAGSPEVVRPLLDVWRSEILAYCAEHALQPRDDPENRSLAYRRNRVRLRLIPLLEAEFNPRIRAHLVALARLAADENRYLEAQAEAWRATAFAMAAEGWSVPASMLAAAPLALARRAVRQALAAVGATAAAADRAAVERILALARGELPTAVDLPGAPLRAIRRGDRGVVEPVPTTAAPPAGEAPLPVPGRAVVAGIPGAVRATQEPVPPDLHAGPWVGYLAVDRIVGPLRVRAWRRGDRFQPLGAPGERKLSDIFIDRKIPRDERQRLPVVADDRRIVWVAGVGVSEAVRVRPETAAVIRIAWEREAAPSPAEE